MRRLAILGLFAGLLGASPAAASVVLVTSTGWHTGLVVARADLPAGRIPEAATFPPEIRWVEFSWGSADYFPLADPGPIDALIAVTGSAAVLHVVGRAAPVDSTGARGETIAIPLAPEPFARLISRIDDSFDRSDPPAMPGHQPLSRFYPARGRFSLTRTCNTWTAEMLAAAGVAVDPGAVVRSEDLLGQIRPRD